MPMWWVKCVEKEGEDVKSERKKKEKERVGRKNVWNNGQPDLKAHSSTASLSIPQYDGKALKKEQTQVLLPFISPVGWFDIRPPHHCSVHWGLRLTRSLGGRGCVPVLLPDPPGLCCSPSPHRAGTNPQTDPAPRQKTSLRCAADA